MAHIAREHLPIPDAQHVGLTTYDAKDPATSYPPITELRPPQGAPNVLIVLIDDVGFGASSAFGGPCHTPVAERLAGNGLKLNRFHTTALCSPTRQAMLTGRNHHSVGMGAITEMATSAPGNSSIRPKNKAPIAETLRLNGYSTAQFGKCHEVPMWQVSPVGPYDQWPTGSGFEYFYGFIGGEANQYYPGLYEGTTAVEPPRTPEEGYTLTEDLADHAITWVRQQKALMPDKPFFMYWASGCLHGPHHIMKDWADKYAGKFDDGWDAYRQRVFERAKDKGWIPQDCALTERDATLPAWDDIPEDEKPFQRRLMEVAAGYAEHVDVQVGRITDELEALGYADNTLFLYIWGDNGSSGEGQNGTISELLAQNGIPTTVRQHIDALEELGGLDVLGSPLVDNQYHAGWAWAGSTPYKGMKLLASDLGGTRNPLAVRWPAKIAADAVPRDNFLHCNDIVPTIYDIVGIEPPCTVYGEPQMALAGSSFARTLADRNAPGGKKTQYFEIMGSRAIYHDGWMASARGPRLPWVPGQPPGIATWTPDLDVWELYNLDEDWSQANDLAAEMPEKLAQMREMFAIEAARNAVLPIGGGLWVPVYHPELRIAPPFTEWEFSGDMIRMPEFCAPALGNKNNVVTIDLDVPETANGVLYALGSGAGGLTCFFENGQIRYEYNLFILQRTKIQSEAIVAPGRHTITVATRYAEVRPGGPLHVSIAVDGAEVASGTVPISAPLLFTANDCLDIGTCLGSPVSMDYRERAPFPFEGHIYKVHVAYT